MMQKPEFLRKVFSILLLMVVPLIVYYVTFRETPDTSPVNEVFPTYNYSVPTEPIGCKELVDDFCKELYSPDARGNIQVSSGQESYLIRQGRTENNFDSAWHSYYSAIFKNHTLFPKDLRDNIIKRGIPLKIQSLLARPNKKQLSLNENIRLNEFENDIDNQVSNAIDEVALSRLEKIYPGTHKRTEDERPQEADLEYLRIRYRLWSEISIALWKNSDHWKQVKQTFTQLKAAFKKVIETKVEDEALKAKWLKKLEGLRLELPGKNPVTANSNCISTSRNAHYYPYLNTLTVCAGYFNSGEQIQTLAHEISHALDNTSTLIDFQQKASITKKLRSVKNQVCRKKDFSCDSWTEFKKSYKNELTEIESYTPDIRGFHQCLQKKKPVREITEDDYIEKAQKIIKERFSDMTENSSFFRIIDEKLPLPSGKLIDNPNHLNPCAYYLWDNDPFSLDAELFSLIFFTYELPAAEKSLWKP